MTSYLETGFDLPPYLDGRYDLTPYRARAWSQTIPTHDAGTITRNHARDAEEFDGTERTAAGYAMAEIYAGPKLFILPGVRYEYTSDDFVGRNVRFAPNGAWLGDRSRSQSTDELRRRAAGLSRAYAATPNTNLRFAVTRTLARPNYYDTVPYRAQDDNAQHRRARQRRLAADDVVERRCAGRALFQVGRRRLGRCVLQAPERLHLHLHAPAADQRRAVSGDAAAQRRFGDAARRRTGAAESAAVPAGAVQRHRRLRELHFHRFDGAVPEARGNSTLPGQSQARR